MMPLVTIGPFTIKAYFLFMYLSVAVFVFYSLYRARSEGYSRGKFTLYLVCLSVLTLFLSRALFFIVFLPKSGFTAYLIRVISVNYGGASAITTVMAGVISSAFLSRLFGYKNVKILDTLFVPLALTLAIQRIGCFSGGCCFGKPTDLPIGIIFTDPNCLAPRNIALYPTQLYHIISDMTVWIFLVLFTLKKRRDGEVSCLFVILYSTFRFVGEFFRATSLTLVVPLGKGQIFINIPQTLCVLALFTSAFLYFLILRRKSDAK
jgi:phosphatidylglycerol---prolipoprotein diacylglyceryl transferase